MFDTITSAEGGGWGVKGSASVDVMRQSQTSENTVSFTIGMGKSMFRKTVRNPNKMKLTQVAKDLLNKDPKAFLK